MRTSSFDQVTISGPGTNLQDSDGEDVNSEDNYGASDNENDVSNNTRTNNGSSLSSSNLKLRSMSFNIKRVIGKLQTQEPDSEQSKLEKAIKKKELRKRLKKVFNFSVGTGSSTKLFRYEDISFGCLTKRNRFRQFCVKLSANGKFKNIVLFLIIINAVIFSICDYEDVDSTGKLLTANNWRNDLSEKTNLFFVIIFTLEMVIKMVAMGIYGKHGSYMSSVWNVFDFIVVLSGILVVADSDMENVSSLRIIRELRPLRSLKMIPAMRSIISSIFVSIPELGGVFSLLGFIFFLFAITGMEIFSDASSHSRCRTTPYPVKLDYISPQYDSTSLHNYADYRCTTEPTFNSPSDNEELNMGNSPWRIPKDCYWPVVPTLDDSDVTECSLLGIGLNNCIHSNMLISPSPLKLLVLLSLKSTSAALLIFAIE